MERNRTNSSQPFPGVISAVVAQEKSRVSRGRRVNVFVDGKFSFALGVELAIDRGLCPGMILDDQSLYELLREDSESGARRAALLLLNRRLRSRAELKKQLERAGWSGTVVDRVLDELQSAGVQDDAHFATAWVATRAVSRPRGSALLKRELLQKGIESETIAASLPDAETELRNAVQAVRSVWLRCAGLETRARREKTLALLQRRGFGFAVARAAIGELENET